MYACVFVRVHIKARNKGISIQIDRRKGAAHGNQFDARELIRGKETSGKI